MPAYCGILRHVPVQSCLSWRMSSWVMGGSVFSLGWNRFSENKHIWIFVSLSVMVFNLKECLVGVLRTLQTSTLQHQKFPLEKTALGLACFGDAVVSELQIRASTALFKANLGLNRGTSRGFKFGEFSFAMQSSAILPKVVFIPSAVAREKTLRGFCKLCCMCLLSLIRTGLPDLWTVRE